MTAERGGFFGHPVGLGYLAAVEGCWYIGYAGAQTLLTLYMSQWLFLPGHIEQVIGIGPYRAALEAVYGPLTPLGLSSQTFGLFTALVYALPLLGGLIADRWAGQRRVALAGLILLGAGCALLVSGATFLIGLAGVILGSGLSKSNLVGQIGRLYSEDDPKRTRAFGIYYIALNTGSMITPLIAGTLADRVGWSAGFAAIAVGACAATAIYLAGQRHMPPDTIRVRRDGTADAPKLRAGDGAVLAALVFVILLDVLFVGAYNQTFNILPVWGEQRVDRVIAGFTMPTTWFVTFDGLFTILGTALSVRLWSWQSKRGREPDDVTRLQIGFAIGTAAFLVLAFGALRGNGVPLAFPIAYLALVDLSIAWADMVILSLVSRAAPPAVATTMLGIYFLATTAGNLVVGWLGVLYERMSPTAFWLVHAAIMAAALPLLFVGARWLRRSLHVRT